MKYIQQKALFTVRGAGGTGLEVDPNGRFPHNNRYCCCCCRLIKTSSAKCSIPNRNCLTSFYIRESRATVYKETRKSNLEMAKVSHNEQY